MPTAAAMNVAVPWPEVVRSRTFGSGARATCVARPAPAGVTGGWPASPARLSSAGGAADGTAAARSGGPWSNRTVTVRSLLRSVIGSVRRGQRAGT